VDGESPHSFHGYSRRSTIAEALTPELTQFLHSMRGDPRQGAEPDSADNLSARLFARLGDLTVVGHRCRALTRDAVLVVFSSGDRYAGSQWPGDVAGGCRDRGGAGVGGERGRRPEPMNRADASQNLGGVHRPDAAKFGQCAPRCIDGGFDVAGGFGDTTVELADLGDEVDSQAAQRLDCGIAGRRYLDVYEADDESTQGCYSSYGHCGAGRPQRPESPRCYVRRAS
jgi:hypothetical protein